ncbi:MAG: cycX [Tardiphaga sp.]|jgi:heme exporter protein D|nr:cycX [Tardiphaga sp.]MDB5546947.1 cycX [Tardiphaga sp.]
MSFASLGPYSHFIVACYALVALVVVILIVWIALDYRRQTTMLRDLDKAGVARRSGRSASDLR